MKITMLAVKARGSAPVFGPVLGLVLTVAIVLGSGCNSIEDTSNLYEDLIGATSAGQAERAISNALRAAGVGDPNQPGPYLDYRLSGQSLRGLSEALAAYNRGDESAGRSLRGVYELSFKTDSPPTVELDAAVEIMWKAANLTLDQEDANLTLLLGSVQGTTPPVSFEPFEADAAISPFQAYMWGIWLHQNGSGLAYYALAIEQAESAGKTGAWEVPTCRLDTINCTMSASSDCLGDGGSGLDELNFCLSHSTCVFGTCAGSDPGGCQATYASCISAAGGDSQTCEDDRTQCLHDQGLGG